MLFSSLSGAAPDDRLTADTGTAESLAVDQRDSALQTRATPTFCARGS